ncbi:uncharacterized protein V6R79_003570 [Siganus canaliculatus]
MCHCVTSAEVWQRRTVTEQQGALRQQGAPAQQGALRQQGERIVATEQETPRSFSDGADGSNTELELLKSGKDSTCEL